MLLSSVEVASSSFISSRCVAFCRLRMHMNRAVIVTQPMTVAAENAMI